MSEGIKLGVPNYYQSPRIILVFFHFNQIILTLVLKFGTHMQKIRKFKLWNIITKLIAYR